MGLGWGRVLCTCSANSGKIREIADVPAARATSRSSSGVTAAGPSTRGTLAYRDRGRSPGKASSLVAQAAVRYLNNSSATANRTRNRCQTLSPAMLSRDIDRDGFRETEVAGLRFEVPSDAPIVLLKEAHGDRYLPIWIGAVEATAIAFAQQGMISLRPLTHDLFRDVLEAVDIRLLSGRITSLVNGIFDGDLVLSNGSIVRSRPSDTITLAMRTGAPVLVSDEILAQAGCDISDITQAPQAGDPDRDKMKPGRTDEARSAPGRDPTGLTMHEPRTAVMIELELVGSGSRCRQIRRYSC